MSKLCSGQTLELQIQGWFIANPFNDCDFSLMTPKRLRMLKSKISIGSIIKYTVCILMNTYIFGYVIQHYLSYILFIRMGLHYLLAQIQLFAFAHFFFWSADFCLIRLQKSAQKNYECT